ncbi:MAG TPA: hypothetical protein PLZ32_10770 [Saprospiraceae bacterium]|nr:hypothetical protein [Saprospiraceae bacterium]
MWQTIMATVLCILSCFDSNAQSFEFRGLTMVAPPRKIDIEPIHRMRQTNANWVALVPYAFQRMTESNIKYNLNGQWWGENVEGIKSSIELAHRGGMHVMVKPQIYVRGAWTGDIDYKTDAEWQTWEKDYSAYILAYANVAQEGGAELFCLGTELKTPIKRRPAYFQQLIKEVRKIYKGKITYAANWDDYQMPKFWQDLDYIGVNAYHPLTESPMPSKHELGKEWKSYMAKMARFSRKMDRKILFTEFGYLSVDGCAWKPWEMQDNLKVHNLNEDAQAVAFDALFECFARQSWWAGGFIWKWFPNKMGHEGNLAKDFSPQDKKAEAIVEQWYCRQ